MRHRIRRTASFVLLLACAPLALAQETQNAPPSPVSLLEQALAKEPNDAVLAFFLGLLKSRSGDVGGALDALEGALLGNGLLPSDATFPALASDPRFARLKARFERRLERRTDGRVAFTLADRTLVPEGIAYDARTSAFYVGSIARRAIYRIGRNGTLVPLSRPADALDEVLGLAIDAPSRRLYAVSTNALTDAGRTGRRNSVKAYDLASGALVRTFEVPGARQLNDVAVARGDVLLVTDSEGGGVWRIDIASGDVRALVPLDTARGANGIAVAASGDVAYVAASRRPIVVDLASGSIAPMPMPAGENAAAIDGLYLHDGALIGVQNFTTPARIVRLVLAPDGRSIARVETLQSHHQRAFNEPTTGAIAPDGFYVLARTFVTRYNDRGTLDDPKSIAAPIVLRIPLSRG